MDGFLDDWEGSAGHRAGEGSDLTVEVRAARDGAWTYLVVGARDDRFVPTPVKGEGGDRVRVTVGGDAAFEVLPGDLEDRLPAARWVRKGKGLASPKADGATRPAGWILELGFAETDFWERGWHVTGLDLGVEVVDDDGDGPPTTLEVPLRLRFPEGAATRALLLESLECAATAAADHELVVQVGGDGRPEWVLAFGNALGVMGEGLGEAGFSSAELPMSPHGRVVSLKPRDLDRDGSAELLVRQEVTVPDAPGTTQEVLYVYDWTPAGLAQLFAVEVANRFPAGEVVNRVRFAKKHKPGTWPEIRVKALRSEQVREETYADPDRQYDSPYQPLLLPWGSVREAAYEYDSGRYVRK